MRLSEIKGGDAIDVIADIIDPVTAIIADKDVAKVIKGNKPKLLIAKTILKKQKDNILLILAILNQENPKEFKPSLVELPVMLIQLITDVMENEELMSLFHSQDKMISSVSSTPVMQTTEETEKM